MRSYIADRECEYAAGKQRAKRTKVKTLACGGKVLLAAVITSTVCVPTGAHAGWARLRDGIVHEVHRPIKEAGRAASRVGAEAKREIHQADTNISNGWHDARPYVVPAAIAVGVVASCAYVVTCEFGIEYIAASGAAGLSYSTEPNDPHRDYVSMIPAPSPEPTETMSTQAEDTSANVHESSPFEAPPADARPADALVERYAEERDNNAHASIDVGALPYEVEFLQRAMNDPYVKDKLAAEELNDTKWQAVFDAGQEGQSFEPPTSVDPSFDGATELAKSAGWIGPSNYDLKLERIKEKHAVELYEQRLQELAAQKKTNDVLPADVHQE